MSISPVNATSMLRNTSRMVPLVAAGLMPFLMSSTALAACTAGPAVIDCTGDLTNGVSKSAAAPTTTLNVFGLTNTIAGMAAGVAGVELFAVVPSGTNGSNGTNGDPATAGSPGGPGSLGGNVILNYQDTNFGIVGTNADVNGLNVVTSGGSGGSGGVGGLNTGVGAGGAGGAGGTGGDGGVVVVNSVAPSINVTGNGIIAISAGGFGGAGGDGGGAVGAGQLGGPAGAGGNGGLGGPVSITNSGAGSITSGGSAIVGASFGGTGGVGGNGGTGPGGQSTSGSGGNGAAGGSVAITNTQALYTTGNQAAGIIARSLGGKGGAVGTGGFTSYGVGGDGGAVLVSTTNVVYTNGTGAHGVMAQSIGGAGSSSTGADFYSLNPTGTVQSSAGASAVTVLSGSDINVGGLGAYGIIAQSIAHGGGFGGTGLSRIGNSGGGTHDSGPVIVQLNAGSSIATWASSNGGGVLAQSISGGGGFGTGSGGTIGGNGGATVTGNAGTVQVVNNGDFINTGGTSIFAQSIGGGGGMGNFSGGGMVIGGFSNAGANGGRVTIDNASGLISVYGFGIAAQSIGGGGGIGTEALASGVTIGGSSVTGSGEIVTVRHTAGNIDAANSAVMAQSIGGGGGMAAGPANAVALGGLNSIGSGGRVTIEVSGGAEFSPQLISSHANNAGALVAQSVGGGGGISTGDGTGLALGRTNSVGSGGLAEVFTGGHTIVTTFGNNAYGIIAQSIGGGGGIGNMGSAGGNVTFGANSSNPSNGGVASVVNNYVVRTSGFGAHGIVAQSVGGGGGIQQNNSTLTNNNYVLIGAEGGGSGGNVGVTSSIVYTTGNSAIGIVAQSVGGGGGMGGTYGAGFSSSAGVRTGFAGSAGNTGNAGKVDVTSGIVTTEGASAVGIFAQSFAGQGNSGAVTVGSATLSTQGVYAVGIDVLSQSRTGNAGAVKVTSTNLDTMGADAYGINAYSMTTTGNSGAVDVTSTVLSTTGAGAVGIIAVNLTTTGNADAVTVNSTDLETHGASSLGIAALSSVGTGNAGAVTVDSTDLETHGANAIGIQAISLATAGAAGNVTVNNHTAITTRADGTTAIQAQSLGGSSNGNILVTNDVDGKVVGGNGGTAIELIDGKANQINNSKGGYISTFYLNTSPAAIASSKTILGGAGDDVVNNHSGFAPIHDPVGSILLLDLHYLADDGHGYQGPGIYGNVLLGAGTNAFNNFESAYFAPGDTVNLGAGNLLYNEGIISPGHFYNVLTTNVTGNFDQTITGSLLTDIDFSNNTADRLNISGTATLDGGFVTLSYNNPGQSIPGSYNVTILSATGGRGGTTFDDLQGVDTNPDPNIVQTAVFQATLNYPNANDARISYNINFAPSGLTGNQGAVGGAVNAIQTAANGTETSFSPVAAQLFFVPTVANLAAVYDSLSGEGVSGMQQAVFYARNQFFDTTMDQMEGQAGRAQKYRVWVSGFGGSGHVNGSSGSGRNDYNAYGGALGLDMMVTPNTLLGLSVGGGRAEFSVPSRWTSGHGDGWNVALYGEANFPLSPSSAVYLRGLLSYGGYNMSESRTAGIGLDLRDPWPLINPRLVPVGAGQVRGSTDTNSFGGRFELGWRNQLGQLNVTPFANIQFDNQHLDGFSEDGYLGLHFGSRSVTSVPGALGVQLDGTFPLGAGGMSLRPKVRVSWVHEFETERSNTASFLLAPGSGLGFKTTGAPAVSDAARVDAGAQLMITPALSIDAGFTGYFAGRGTAVGGMGAVKLRF